MSRLVLTSFGRPARSALEALVADAKGADALAPVSVAVPSSYAGLALRRHDPRFGPDASPGLVNIRFLALNRVAELLGAPFLAEPDHVPLTPQARREAARVAVAEEPGVFAPVAGHPSTVRALLAAFADLRAADDEALARLARESERSASVVRCYHRFRELTLHAYDEEDQLRVAASLVAAQGVPADLGALVLFLPERLSPGTLAMVEGFASRTFTAAVLGLTGDPEADAETRALAATLSAHLGPAVDAGPEAPRLGDRVVSAPDPDTEVREVVRALVDRADRGRSLHDVAVAWRVGEPHARLLHERLAEAGIPVYGPSVRTLADTVTGRTLVALLDLVERDFRRDDIMALVAGAPIRESAGGPHASTRRGGTACRGTRASSPAPTSGGRVWTASATTSSPAPPRTRTRSGSPGWPSARSGSTASPRSSRSSWPARPRPTRPGRAGARGPASSSSATSASHLAAGPRPRSTRRRASSTGSRPSAPSRP